MLYFELIGIPGAGKSTLMKSLMSSNFKLRGTRCLSSDEALIIALKSRKDQLLFQWALSLIPLRIAKKHTNGILNLYKHQNDLLGSFLAKHRKIIDILSNYMQCNRIPNDEKSLVISRFFFFLGYYQAVDEKFDSNTPVFFDSAFLQRSMSIFISPQTAVGKLYYRDIETYLNAVPLPAVAVFVDSDIDICHRRLLARPRGMTKRMSGLDDSGTRLFLTACRELFQMIIEILEKKGIRVIRIQNSDALTTALDHLSKSFSDFSALHR